MQIPALNYTITTSPVTSTVTTTSTNVTLTGLTFKTTYTISLVANYIFGTPSTAITTTVTPDFAGFNSALSQVTLDTSGGFFTNYNSNGGVIYQITGGGASTTNNVPNNSASVNTVLTSAAFSGTTGVITVYLRAYIFISSGNAHDVPILTLFSSNGNPLYYMPSYTSSAWYIRQPYVTSTLLGSSPNTTGTYNFFIRFSWTATNITINTEIYNTSGTAQSGASMVINTPGSLWFGSGYIGILSAAYHSSLPFVLYKYSVYNSTLSASDMVSLSTKP